MVSDAQRFLHNYYAWLAEKPEGYLELARTYVPDYENIINTIVKEIISFSQDKEKIYCLDAGCGVGYLGKNFSALCLI